MSFKLGHFVGDELKKLALPELRCKTGKTCFNSKAEATSSLSAMRRRGRPASMTPFRCTWCEKWHLGHRRGRVL